MNSIKLMVGGSTVFIMLMLISIDKEIGTRLDEIEKQIEILQEQKSEIVFEVPGLEDRLNIFDSRVVIPSPKSENNP